MITPSPLRRALSPELIALVLVVLIAAGGIVAVASGSTASPTTTPTASEGSVTATASAPATATLVVPTLPIASAPPTSTPIPTTAPSPSTPTWAPAARALIAADERVIQWREALRAELAQRPKTSDQLAPLLRSTNAAIQVASSSLGALEVADAPQDVVGTLETAHRSAQEASVRTLAITVRDVNAYSRGATDVIAALEPLEAALQALAVAAGLPADQVPAAPPSAIPSASTAP